MATIPTVLVVCLHGSAKSVIAQEHFRRLASERGVDARAESAGIEADPEIPPRVIEGLFADAIDVRGRRPRQFTAADLRNVSRVVTFACDLGGAQSPALARERWDDVPAVSDGYQAARDVIVGHVAALLDDLQRSR